MVNEVTQLDSAINSSSTVPFLGPGIWILLDFSSSHTVLLHKELHVNHSPADDKEGFCNSIRSSYAMGFCCRHLLRNSSSSFLFIFFYQRTIRGKHIIFQYNVHSSSIDAWQCTRLTHSLTQSAICIKQNCCGCSLNHIFAFSVLKNNMVMSLIILFQLKPTTPTITTEQKE